jgi:hypothetical protein
VKCDPPETKAHPGPRYRLRAVESSPQLPQSGWSPYVPTLPRYQRACQPCRMALNTWSRSEPKNAGRPDPPDMQQRGVGRAPASLLPGTGAPLSCTLHWAGFICGTGCRICEQWRMQPEAPTLHPQGMGGPKGVEDRPPKRERVMVGMAVSLWLGKGETWRATPAYHPPPISSPVHDPKPSPGFSALTTTTTKVLVHVRRAV